MAFTSAQLDAIEEAVAAGVLTLELDDGNGGRKRITYASVSEMLRVRDLIRKSLGLTGTGQRKYGAFTDGLA